ncbi:MAG: nucleotidyltransferase domain-containing protein [Acidobacteriota bacterium]
MPSLGELRRKIVPLLVPYARSIAIFGSMATGEATDDSDVDVLVELKPEGERPVLGLRWFSLEMELSSVLGRPVDLVSRDSLSPHLLPYVEQHLVVLYAEG